MHLALAMASKNKFHSDTLRRLGGTAQMNGIWWHMFPPRMQSAYARLDWQLSQFANWKLSRALGCAPLGNSHHDAPN